jgi:hypothetical protein
MFLTLWWWRDDGAGVGQSAALHLKVSQALQVIIAQRGAGGLGLRSLYGRWGVEGHGEGQGGGWQHTKMCQQGVEKVYRAVA